MRSIGLHPKALLSRMAALVPPPKRHVTVYSGVLASNSRWRRLIIPKTEAAVAGNPALENAEADGRPEKGIPGAAAMADKKPKVVFSKYIPWHELLRRTFGEEVMCPQCGGKLRLIALVKTEATIQVLLKAMHLQHVFHLRLLQPPGPTEGREPFAGGFR